MKIRFENAATGDSAIFETGDFDVIVWMKKLHLPSDKIYEAYDEVVGRLSLMSNIKRLVNDPGYDMIVMMIDGSPVAQAFMNGKIIDMIFVMEVPGNCVDKFMAYHINKFIAIINGLAKEVEFGQHIRMTSNDYHDTSQFEKDFSALTAIREECNKLSDSIKKFQEDITAGYR